MDVFENFSRDWKQSVNSSKTNVTFAKTQSKEKICITYNNESLKIIINYALSLVMSHRKP